MTKIINFEDLLYYFCSMNKSLVFFILFLVFFHAFAKVAYVIYWRIHQEKIAATSCINKNKPAMKCKGKCQLMKMADVADQKDSKATIPPLQKQPNPYQYIFENATLLSLVFPEENNFHRQYPFYARGKIYNHPLNCFHPPESTVLS